MSEQLSHTEEQQRQRRRRNLLLFAVHVLLAVAVLAAFVYKVTHP